MFVQSVPQVMLLMLHHLQHAGIQLQTAQLMLPEELPALNVWLLPLLINHQLVLVQL